MTNTREKARPARAAVSLVAVAVAAVVAGCGGGGSADSPLPPLPGVSCSTADERAWLDRQFDEYYFWYRQAPNPNPARDMTVAEFFRESLYTGNDPAFPAADRWSNQQPTADFDRFFEQGRALGYGLFIAGLETGGQSGRPLRVRLVEPNSDAAAKGVLRGDEIVSANGRSAAQMIAANDFSPLAAGREGETLTLVLRAPGGAERTVVLSATSYLLQPVGPARVLQTPQGRRMAYLHVKDMISQAEPGLTSAFADFRAQGVQELALDLRYNGGGLVTLSGTLASFVSAARTNDRTYTRLLYNDKRADRDDRSYRFGNPAQALSLSRVYVLTGPRTCSASELVINGLKPFVEVVTVGDTTCGKPVGFAPVDRCNTTFSIVNFEAVNASGQGRYWGGFTAQCAVAEDFSKPLGDAAEPLLAAAARMADGGACAAGPAVAQRRILRAGPAGGEPAEQQGMWDR